MDVQNGQMKIYKNGSLITTYNTSIVPNYASIQYFRIAKSHTSYQGHFLLNDFRLYDHCLSLKEVKELSKGLILHYPLSDTYLQPTVNLITTEDGLSNTCFNGATRKYNYGISTDMYKVVTTFDGKKGTKVYMGTSGNNCYPYVYISNMYTSNGTNAPEYKTLSFDYYTTISTSISPYKLGNGNGTATYIVKNKNGIQTGTGTNSVVIPVISNAWNHIEITFHGTTDADAQWGYIQNQPTHISDTSNFWFFANMQLETKDHATPYAGVNGIRNENIIYDCSGYQNNGIVNDITYSIDTPKYSFSSQFTSSNNSYIKVNNNNWMAQYTKEMTINLWAYADNWSNQVKLFSCTESGGFNTESGNSGYIRFPIYVCTNQEQTSYAYKYDSKQIKNSDLSSGWHMFTFIYEAATGTKTYIDGQLHHIYNNVSYGIRFNINARLFLGCQASGVNPSSPYFNGKQSDFRIYYTVLSEDDIKQLYSIRASGDRDSNFYSSGKFIEEEQKSITKQGITKSLLYEIGLPVRYIKDTITGSSANSYNHWCEIQIFNILDQNIALHKDVTFTKDSTSSTYSNSVVTDGTINSSYFPSGWGNTTSAIIDLGQTQNVTKIKIWHYYPDGRTYHNNITQVSIDGENWTTVYSTLISGEKAQTVNGNEILLSPDKIFYTRDNYLYTNSFIEN